MDLNTLLAALVTALGHLAETTRERDELRAELVGIRRELEELKNKPVTTRARKR